ncbi:Ribonuclease VapC [Thermococcus nautili]|uniref:PIN domain-containing protein n=1 Tax=Thermococcus nautili TaxID=195522 RepID=UPI00255696EE|nr:PIN domain-containing protein [Thermococcus nautili]CAI1493691.1 Ribonuclease VapC [Thermococcus nautili]
MIYVDSNVFYNYLFETSLTERAFQVLEKNRGIPATSFSTVEEATYVVLRKFLSEKAGIRNRYDAKRYLKTSEGRALIDEAFTSVLALIFQYDVELVEDATSPGLVQSYAVKYGLMPRDAQIVATCLLNGIKKIATFDNDFDDVDELSVIR